MSEVKGEYRREEELFQGIRDLLESDRRQTPIVVMCLDLCAKLVRKNRDYGDSAFKEPLLLPGMPSHAAILVRMSDKIERLRNLFLGGKMLVDESCEDTVHDLAGYCILLALQMQRERD